MESFVVFVMEDSIFLNSSQSCCMDWYIFESIYSVSFNNSSQ